MLTIIYILFLFSCSKFTNINKYDFNTKTLQDLSSDKILTNPIVFESGLYLFNRLFDRLEKKIEENLELNDHLTNVNNIRFLNTLIKLINKRVILDELIEDEDNLKKYKDKFTTKTKNLLSKFNNVLIEIVMNSEEDKLKDLIAASINLNIKRQDGQPLLFLGNCQILQILIDANIDLNTTDKEGNTALIRATDYAIKDKFTLLIEAGANLNIKNKNGFTALIIAARERPSNYVEKLIKAGANLNMKSACGSTALMWAIFFKNQPNDHIPIKFIDLGYGSHWNNTLNYIKIISLLINAGADPDSQNNDGNTLLHYAVFKNDKETASLLMGAGSDPNLQNNDGDTPLSIAKRHKNNEFIEIFITNTDINIQLVWRASNNNKEEVEKLINIGANPDSKSDSGNPILLLAAAKGDTDILNTLIAAGANLDLQNNYGDSALTWASKNGHLNCVNILIRSGANPNLQNNNGDIPIMSAIGMKHRNCFEQLRAVSDFSLINKSGHNALTLAKATGYMVNNTENN